MEEEIKGDVDVVMSYKRVFGCEDGENVLNDLKRQCRYYDSRISTVYADTETIRALHMIRTFVNYLEAMRDREPRKRPEEKHDFVDIPNGY